MNAYKVLAELLSLSVELDANADTLDIFYEIVEYRNNVHTLLKANKLFNDELFKPYLEEIDSLYNEAKETIQNLVDCLLIDLENTDLNKKNSEYLNLNSEILFSIVNDLQNIISDWKFDYQNA